MDEKEAAGPRVLPVLAAAALAFSVAQTAVVPAIGELSRTLEASPGDVSWVMSAYLMAAAVLTPVIGRLGDMTGKRRMLIIVLAVFTAAGVAAALVTNVWALVACRVLQGVGGGIYPLCFGIIADGFPARRRPVALGVVSALTGIGAGGGLILGGLLLDHASWQWIFWSGAIISGCALLGTVLLPGGGPRSPGRIDVVGVLLVTVGLTVPLFALTRTPAWGWGDPRTLGLFLAGGAVLALFVRHELRTDDPLVDMRVLARPVVWITNVTVLLFGFGMFGAFVLVLELAQAPASPGPGFGLDATGAGLLLIPGTVAMLAAGAASGRIWHRLGPRTPLTTGSLTAAAALALLATEHGSRWTVTLLATAVLAGIGLGMAAVPNIIAEAVPPDRTGESNGVNALLRSVGAALGSQIVATLLASGRTPAHPSPADPALTCSFWLCATALTTAGLLLSRLTPHQRSRPPSAALPAAPWTPTRRR
ncbi:MFS transporter [Actinocorallia longicatena]|uniref:MFS transporter n=1 Tax=Actinocorallia longicatena TaxID=111803 RepID=A0ABP6QJN1_9ACTN